MLVSGTWGGWGRGDCCIGSTHAKGARHGSGVGGETGRWWHWVVLRGGVEGDA